jgi:hypothetical protein
MQIDYVKFLGSLIEFTESKVFVEVGVEVGDSTVDFCEYLKQTGGHLYGFDMWAEHGLNLQYPPKGSKEYVEQRLKSGDCDNFTLTRVNTIDDRATFEKNLDELLNGRKIDFAFIDACHSYIGIKNDFEVVYPRLSPTGIVAFHDTLMIDGCREFVFDLRTKFFDGTYDIVDFPLGSKGSHSNVGVSILTKRTFPLVNRPINQICGSPSSPDQIEVNEVQWLKEEIEKHKDHKPLNQPLTKQDMSDVLLSNNLRPLRDRKFE